jgi:hypothetical protein
MSHIRNARVMILFIDITPLLTVIRRWKTKMLFIVRRSMIFSNWRRCLQISHRCPWNIGIPKWNKNQYFAHWNNLRFCYQISYRCLWNTEISNWNKNRFSPSEINTVVCITITPQYQRRNNRKLDHNTNFVTIENIIERKDV